MLPEGAPEINYAVFVDRKLEAIRTSFKAALRATHRCYAKNIHILVEQGAQKPELVCWIKPRVLP